MKNRFYFNSTRSSFKSQYIFFIFFQLLDQPECWFTRSSSQEKFYFWFEHKISHTIIYVYSFSLPITANDWNILSSVKTHPRQYILLVVTNNDQPKRNKHVRVHARVLLRQWRIPVVK